MITVLRRFLEPVCRASSILAAACVGITAFVFVAEIIGRYGFSSPLNWSGDMGRYLLCIAVFLALPDISRSRRHVSVSVVVDFLPAGARKAHIRLIEIITALVLVAMAWFASGVAVDQFDQGVLTPLANQIPRWWLTSVMCFGLGLSAVMLSLPAPEDDNPEVEI